ncbi:MAG: 3-methyl-2-oxobutanoate dehydrogenase subunit VorB [Spirochaetales bacterium]|nr:3-methyl-2-oxobutanoate dehydrogenase subunit VorB [Spirochaetales bacterium]
MEKKLMKGNEAAGAAAILAGCKYFFGYPITPQNELPEYMARELPKCGGTYLQAESEIGAINMVYGASGAGARVMTSSSSPGIALKQEGISYLAGAELPCVIVNMMRSSPGLGGIQPAQGDYFMATRGGGNGDYFTPVYAPASVQELVDLIIKAFDTADLYRTPVMVLGDGMIGQMMEPVELKIPEKKEIPAKDWAVKDKPTKGDNKLINSLYIIPEELEEHIQGLFSKYEIIKQDECMYEMFNCEDADVISVAYGTSSRIVRNAIKKLENDGIKMGLIRPITLWPFPVEAFEKIGSKTKALLCVEMSAGQMIDDVKIANEGRLPVEFFGRSGGVVPKPEEIVNKVKEILGGNK